MVEKKMVCKECGSEDDTWTAYCGKCGRSLHTIEEKTLSDRIYKGYQDAGLSTVDVKQTIDDIKADFLKMAIPGMSLFESKVPNIKEDMKKHINAIFDKHLGDKLS